MDLKSWNKLQCDVFNQFNIQDITEIYRIASAISFYRDFECNEDTIYKIINIVRELTR